MDEQRKYALLLRTVRRYTARKCLTNSTYSIDLPAPAGPHLKFTRNMFRVGGRAAIRSIARSATKSTKFPPARFGFSTRMATTGLRNSSSLETRSSDSSPLEWSGCCRSRHFHCDKSLPASERPFRIGAWRLNGSFVFTWTNRETIRLELSQAPNGGSGICAFSDALLRSAITTLRSEKR